MGKKHHNTTDSGLHRFTEDGRIITVGVDDDEDEDDGGEVAHARTRQGDPTNVWGFLLRIAERFGIAALICLAMMYVNWKTMENHRADAAKAHDEFSKIMQSIAANQVQTNIELVKIGDALDRHLASDEGGGKNGKGH